MTSSANVAFQANTVKTNWQKTNVHEENHDCTKNMLLQIKEWVMDIYHDQIGWRR